jgi:hypothetical protein
MRSLNPRPFALLLVSIASLSATQANASPGFGDDVLTLRVGGYFSDFETNVRLSGPNGGDKVNLEDSLGLDPDQTVVRGGLTWRFAPRHRLVVEYVDFNRSSTGTAERNFVIDTEDGTYEFAAGATLNTNFDWTLTPITYTYSFYKTPKLELAGSAGIHWFRTSIGYEGAATVTPPGGVPSPVISAAESESASGPLPVFGLQAGYALTPQWIIGAKLGWFGLDYDDYSGELWDFGLTSEYWFSDHFGAGIGYSRYSIEITEDKDRYEAAIDYTYDGANVYIALRF